MKTIRYSLLDPTKNGTVRVETPVPPERQPAVAARLMALEPEAEQVGFVADLAGDPLLLRMAGGEFCGNAAMSAAALRSERAGRDRDTVRLRFSGAEITADVQVQKEPDGSWTGTVKMPRPAEVRLCNLPETGEWIP